MDGNLPPLGATLVEGGITIAVWSQNATRIWICLFDEKGEQEVERVVLRQNGDVHSAFVPNVKEGARYGLRADGPFDPAHGHRFDPSKLLVDPYATAIDRPFAYQPQLGAPREAEIDTAVIMPKAIVTGPPAPAEALPPVERPGFVYELSVRGFTKLHRDVPNKLRGTVAALAQPKIIDHLTGLNVDTVELMPIVAWIDERHLPPLGLANAWGYNPVAFMAPDPRLAPGGIAEIASTIASLHKAGIRVILDAVYNHTGESDAIGATLSLRGLDNAVYFRHGEGGRLVNDTGTGNTLACDRLPVVRLITDAMRHFIMATGVDGFRLDLAAILGRAGDGGFDPDSPLFQAIEVDPLLKDRIMIAEPWDIGPGGYQMGNFPKRWAEWNDRFRDDVRRFWRGDRDTLGTLATRIAGSADIFGKHGRPSASVNFLAAHDGFTLNDLVSFAGKHNEANGEANHDGTGEDFSWNNGVEGPSKDKKIETARRRDIAALLATLFIARGTPMLTAGDEFRRSQQGNNNAYAQDNAIIWVDWRKLDTGLADFTARLSGLRKAHPSLSDDRFLTGQPIEGALLPDVGWLHPEGRPMRDADWSAEARVLGIAFATPGDRTLIWINGTRAKVSAFLPPVSPGQAWELIADSSDPNADFVTGSGAGRIVLPMRSVRVYAVTAR
jgi:glycogen operon protein